MSAVRQRGPIKSNWTEPLPLSGHLAYDSVEVLSRTILCWERIDVAQWEDWFGANCWVGGREEGGRENRKWFLEQAQRRKRGFNASARSLSHILHPSPTFHPNMSHFKYNEPHLSIKRHLAAMTQARFWLLGMNGEYFGVASDRRTTISSSNHLLDSNF